jgi:hypothetical protein
MSFVGLLMQSFFGHFLVSEFFNSHADFVNHQCGSLPPSIRQSEGAVLKLFCVMELMPQRFHNQTDQRIRNGIRR